MIPLIPLVKPYLPDPDILMPEIESVLYSGYIAEGESVYEFERQFGDFIQNNKTLAVCSGTAALHLALLMLGVGEGDEVISTALTAEPTNTTIALTGAKVVWADIEPDTGLSSPESVKALISERTKAIMLVHYAGMVCDMDKFTALARDSGVPIIEDAAHALGARYAGKPVGCHSPYTAFSFQAIKHMTTVDGGALALGAGQSLEPVRRLRWFGLDKFAPRLSNNIVRAGYKYNMNNVTAVIGLCQLRDVERIISRHILNGKCYDNELRDIPGVSLLRYSDNTEPSYWLYTMKVTQRCDFIQAMESRGVAVSPLHLRNDRHEVFAGSKCELPVLDTFYDEFVHIPCGWWVGDEDRDLIVQAIKKGW